MTEHVEAASLLQHVRNFILGVFAVVFFLGGLVGFFIGKAFGRRG